MRGSPLLRAVLAFLALALLGWPLWQLTHPSAVEPIAAVENTGVKTARVALTFTLAPQAVTVRHLGKEVWSVQNPAGEIARDLALPWPPDGVDLQFQIDWPADAPLAAARVRVTAPDGREHEKSIFSKGPADEVLTFP